MQLLDNPHKKYLDHGHVVLLDHMGSDIDIEYAARMSYADGTRTVNDTRRLLDYLMRHEHTSPFEMAEFKFQIKMPIFVMRQLVRHRTASLNEVSLRYSVATDEFYLPEPDRMNVQSTTNKQCSDDAVVDKPVFCQQVIDEACHDALDSYNTLLDEGVSREIARSVLPIGGYTEVVWKIDLKNLMHFLKLRLHSHAQKEIQWLAQAMYDLVKETGEFNLTLDAFDRYILNGCKMSKLEMNVLKELVTKHSSDVLDLLDAESGLSTREKSEFRVKLGI